MHGRRRRKAARHWRREESGRLRRHVPEPPARSQSWRAGVGVQARSSAELVDAVDKFDTEGSGSIDVHELESGLRAMGVEKGAAALLCSRFDADGGGQISLSEFEVQLVRISHGSLLWR